MYGRTDDSRGNTALEGYSCFWFDLLAAILIYLVRRHACPCGCRLPPHLTICSGIEGGLLYVSSPQGMMTRETMH